MSWFQLIFGAISLGRELVKYLREREESKKAVVCQVRDMKNALKKARKEGDTSDVKKLFSDISVKRGNP